MEKKKKKKSKPIAKEDFGSVEFHCMECDYTFEIDWETIWDIQECTHGYVGYHLNDTFISCVKCGELIYEKEDPVPVFLFSLFIPMSSIINFKIGI